MDLLIETIRMEVDGGEPVRHKLPGGGRLYIERPLPFLCLYRMRPNGRDRDTRKLLMGEASFLIASGDQTYHDGFQEIRGLLVARDVDLCPEHP
jgi:hypothetical protein